MHYNKFIQNTLCIALLCSKAFAQTGTAQEPVRYIGGEIANPSVHDGALRYAIGVENIQVLRANRSHPEQAEDFGWTYNHAPNLTYWNGQFYLQYLSNPADEHVSPGHTMLVQSKDGRQWEKPRELFPPYPAPAGVKIPEGYHGYMMHQRMGFYTASNGKLLTLAFYGHTDHPFKEGGIGRVVREIKPDGQLGPIYFIRYSSHAKWNESNTAFPFYKSAPDPAFVAACDALLKDKLKTLQWWDEDRGVDGFYTFKDTTDNMEAPSYYHRKDGKVVALWKNSYATLSDDEGQHWSTPQVMPTLLMPGSKNWGQKTKDGRYAMSYNPIATQEYRYPLIVTTSDDGILFDNMGVVHGEAPPRRFFGRWKDFGPNYIRGITEGETTPPGDDIWLVYSVNKEDIWISRVPLPIQVSTTGPVQEDFNKLNVGAAIPNWNIYTPSWAKVAVADFPGKDNHSLHLHDEDPYDYARAIRVFENTQQTDISFKVFVEHPESTLQIDLNDRYGSRPVRLIFDQDGYLKTDNGAKKESIQAYKTGEWYTLTINASSDGMGSFDLQVNGKAVLKKQAFAEKVKSLERISFRTGDYRNLPNRKTPNQEKAPPLAGADEPVTASDFYIDDLMIKQ